MKSSLITIACCFFLVHSVLPQDHDNTWLLGYAGGNESPNDTTYGISILDFSNGLTHIENNQEIGMGFAAANASISSADGELLFYSNCISVGNTSNGTMENGFGLNPPDLGGYDLPQGCLILPYPSQDNKYVLFHETKDWLVDIGVEVLGLYFSVIDMSSNNGLGEVILKKEPLFLDTLDYGKVTAVKHANGRDWWVLLNEHSSNTFYRVLLNKNGINIMENEEVEVSIPSGLGQAKFSPDGRYYARRSGINNDTGDFLDIFEFDRCNGKLSNHIQINYFDDSSGGGVAFSPNSRFLYVSSTVYLYQFDLWAGDIEASKDTVAIYDGFGDPFSTAFFLAQLAPNGKIYISNTNSSNYLHVIHRPNEKGDACMVEQHGFRLPTRNYTSLPNHPNYRLGPLDGSPCDTLGLDNVPVAKYRYEQDSLDYLQVEFTDLSYYEPAEWHWDFGNGNATSQDTSPVHVFPQAGTYEVCLTVSNVNGGHTFCRTLELGTVSSSEEAQEVDITLFPNPCRDGVNVIISEYLPRDAKVVLYDAVGQRQKVQQVRTGWNTLRLDGLGAGIYFYQIWEASSPEPVSGDVLLDSGKLVKVE